MSLVIVLRRYAFFVFIAMAATSFATGNHVDQLLDSIYAVHATRILPTEYVKAGFSPTAGTPLQQTILPQVRRTLHFALGELVRPIEDFMSWEDCPYAVVTPLRVLLPQLLNINCYDTFILGDLKLGPETYLLVPLDMVEEASEEGLATVIAYDPQCLTLREAVDELILSKGGWHIQMNNEDIEDALHEAYLGCENINSAEFFAPLKREYPWLAVGLRFQPLDGEHYRLSQIEMLTVFPMTQLLSPSPEERVETSRLEDTIRSVDDHFQTWSQSLHGFNWCAESLYGYLLLKRELLKWNVFIREEIRIRNTHGKTLKGAPEDLLLNCASLAVFPDEVEAYIDQNLEQLADDQPIFSGSLSY